MRRNTRRPRWWLALGGLVALSGWLLADRADLVGRFAAARTPAKPSVEDRASLFSAEQRERIDEFHAAMREAHDIDYRVLAIRDGGNLDWNAHRYFNDEGIGRASANGRGLLLVIDTKLDRVRLEVSTSLEGVYPDAFVAFVENRQMVPFFRAGRVADGILAATELIVGRALEAEQGHAFVPPMPSRSMGGGAAAPAEIGKAETEAATAAEPSHEAHETDAAALSATQVVEAYLEAMGARDARPDLPLYSAQTVQMLRKWIVTPAQMDNIVKTYRRCEADGVFIRGDRAVVRYRVEQRQCAPHLLRLEHGAWKLDLAAASSSIRFNHNNEWRFLAPIDQSYGFAFEDWRFDRHGFPHPQHSSQ